jgi:hypothetical protein
VLEEAGQGVDAVERRTDDAAAITGVEQAWTRPPTVRAGLQSSRSRIITPPAT